MLTIFEKHSIINQNSPKKGNFKIMKSSKITLNKKKKKGETKKLFEKCSERFIYH